MNLQDLVDSKNSDIALSRYYEGDVNSTKSISLRLFTPLYPFRLTFCRSSLQVNVLLQAYCNQSR